jgi:diguanylate cyclase (GGDEF)-like protein
MNNKEIFSKVSLLYVEDEQEAKIGMKFILGKKFKSLEMAEDGLDGLNKYKNNPTDIIITDIKMPNMNGIEMIKEIKKINPNVKVIYTSAHSDSKILIDAIEAGADEYILKPINKTTLLFSISKVANEIIRDKQIKRYSKFVRLVLDSQDSLVIVTDGKNIVDCNKSVLSFFDKDIDSIKEICISDYFINSAKECEFITKENWIDEIESQKCNKVVMVDKKDDTHKVFMVKLTPFILEEENIKEYVITLTDITILEEQREKLAILATTDQLTQVSNRAKFKIILEKEIQRYQRENSIFSIIFFDIDFFKKINDTYGHNEGDNVLRDLSNLVSENIRSSDTIARWGGEEFIILCIDSNLENSILIAEKLRKIIEEYDFGLPTNVTCSFGVSEYISDESQECFIKRADNGLYKAKESGRNRVEWV